MSRLIVRSMLVLTLIAGLCLGLLLSAGAGVLDGNLIADLHTFLLDPRCDDYDGSCWLGLRVGETTVTEAVTILGAHPWIDEVNIRPRTTRHEISLHWNDQRPAFIRGGRHHLLTEEDGVIAGIHLQQLEIPFAAFWQVAGPGQVGAGYNPIVFYTVPYGTPFTPFFVGTPFMDYPVRNLEPRIRAQVRVYCPLERYSFWDGVVQELIFEQMADGSTASATNWHHIYNASNNCQPQLMPSP